ncbi:MAG TPA: hypothetical protein VFQ53_13960 [Kofleriaceae bacterium]|nr:hypothetical protein [Kofleriaceae bacterium]
MRTLVFVLSIVLAVACGKGDKSGGGGGPTASAPTKEVAIDTLKAVNTALEAKDYNKAADMFGTPAGATKEQLAGQLGGLIEKQEISKAGIDVMASKGKFGKLAEVFPDKGERWAKKFNVPLDECYALSFENGEAAFHWTGNSFKLIRLDDIGKLADGGGTPPASP